MTTISHVVDVKASKQQVWQIIADLGGVVNFHPYVTHSYYTSQKKEGNGASRVCELGSSTEVEETAIEWTTGKSFTLGIAFRKGMKPPISNLQAVMKTEEIAGKTRVTLEMHYQPKYGPVGWMMNQMMIKPQYQKMVPAILAGLKHYAETGEKADLKTLQSLPVHA